MTIRSAIFSSLLSALTTLASAQTDDKSQLAYYPTENTDAAKIVASGNVADEATRLAILGKLRELYGERNIVDRISIGGVSPPPKWTENIEKLLNNSIKQVHNGQIHVNGTQISLKGNVSNAAQRQQISAAITTSLNPHYTITTELTVSESRQEILDKALSNRVIEFESGSASLTSSGQAILNDMVSAIKLTNARNVQIIGHTDNAGSRQSNIELSLARANAVRSYLGSKGIPTTSLSTIGAGPDHPIRNNDTLQGRAQNRRIEFQFLE